jgi:alkanesulfonate monooxygenase SsuD/methylene tetrahydromethanopterin reductase-like flavin-dependent oxidoreductase (luciferase family)
VALTAAACSTKTLRLGTGICLVNQRDPIVTAKAVATRFKRMRENVAAMKAIWSHDESTFHGDFVSFESIASWPKPVQQPHPPILVGGNGPRAVDRVLHYGDGWLPEPEPRIFERIRGFRARADRVRNGHFAVTLYSATPNLVGAAKRAGVERCVFWLPPRPARAVAQAADALAGSLSL